MVRFRSARWGGPRGPVATTGGSGGSGGCAELQWSNEAAQEGAAQGQQRAFGGVAFRAWFVLKKNGRVGCCLLVVACWLVLLSSTFAVSFWIGTPTGRPVGLKVWMLDSWMHSNLWQLIITGCIAVWNSNAWDFGSRNFQIHMPASSMAVCKTSECKPFGLMGCFACVVSHSRDIVVGLALLTRLCSC